MGREARTLGKLQRELLETARRLVSDDIRRDPTWSACWDRVSIVLSGSAVTRYADEYSGIDLIVLGDPDALDDLRDALAGQAPAGDGEPLETWAGGRRVKISLFSFEQAEADLQAYDDFAVAVLPRAPVLHDPGERFARLVAGRDDIPQQVLGAKIAARYRKLRRRRASMAWNLRRGQPYVLLDNLNRFIAHALAVCFYLDGRPPTGRKWIFQGALRTGAGRRLRPRLFELFSSLGQLATLGDSFQSRGNRIYRCVTEIHDTLLEAVRDAGYDVGREPPREGPRAKGARVDR